MLRQKPKKLPSLPAEVEAPIAQPDTTERTPIAPATPSTPAPATLSATKPATATSPAAIGTNDEPPNRGDNGRGRMEPITAKKLMLTLVAVKRISSDVAASNFDRNELEIAGELSLALGGFVIPRRGGARQSRVQGY